MARRGTKLPDRLVAQLQNLHAVGFSIKLLARRLQLSRGTIRKYIRAGLTPLHRGDGV
jgi:hypothetical protein